MRIENMAYWFGYSIGVIFSVAVVVATLFAVVWLVKMVFVFELYWYVVAACLLIAASVAKGK